MDAERLLGAMVRSALSSRTPQRRSNMRSGRRNSATSNAVGMGMLGLAIAAFEHFSTQSKTSGQGGSAVPPPLPGAAVPPPPPFAGASAGPDMPPPPPPSAQQSSGDSLTLVRAMIAAASADGEIDATERDKILKHVKEAGLSKDDEAFIKAELAAPLTLEQIVSATHNEEVAKQVYAASILAIDLDSVAEKQYLQNLASKLKLNQQIVSQIHEQLGIGGE